MKFVPIDKADIIGHLSELAYSDWVYAALPCDERMLNEIDRTVSIYLTEVLDATTQPIQGDVEDREKAADEPQHEPPTEQQLVSIPTLDKATERRRLYLGAILYSLISHDKFSAFKHSLRR